MTKKGIYSICFLLLLLFLTGLVYLPVLGDEYIYDSKQIPGLGRAYSGTVTSILTEGYGDIQGNVLRQGGYYRPLTSISFLLLQKCGPQKQRLVNLILFWGILVFLFLFFNIYAGEQFWHYPLMLVFALYPLHVDNVLWIVGRCDLLMLFFFSGSLFFLGLNIKDSRKWPLVVGSLFFLLGIVSKESMVFLLPALMLYEWSKRRKLTIWFHSFNVISALLFFVVKSSCVGGMAVEFLIPDTILEFLTLGFGAVGYYFKTMLVPFGHNIFINSEEIVTATLVFLGMFFTISGAICLWFGVKKKNEFLFPLSLIAFLFPHLGVIFTSVEPFKASSRYLILPFLGTLLIVVPLLLNIRKRLLIPIVSVIVLFLGAQSFVHTSVYNSDLSYWDYFINQNSSPGFSHYRKADALVLKNRVFEADVYFKRSLIVNRTSKERTLLNELQCFLGIKLAVMKCDYAEVRRLVVKLEKGENKSAAANRCVDIVKADLYYKAGDYLKTIIIANKAVVKFGPRGFAEIVLRLNLGRLDWEKAEDFAERFGMYIDAQELRVPVKKIRQTFEQSDKFGKAVFFERMKNYNVALQILKTLELDEKVALHKVYCLYELERSEEAVETVRFLEQSSSGIKLLTVFFIQEIPLINKAIHYGERLLKASPGERELAAYIALLKRLVPGNTELPPVN